MHVERSCGWMQGPKEVVDIPGAKWWLAVSRGVLANASRRACARYTLPVCHRTPRFTSPLAPRSL